MTVVSLSCANWLCVQCAYTRLADVDTTPVVHLVANHAIAIHIGRITLRFQLPACARRRAAYYHQYTISIAPSLRQHHHHTINIMAPPLQHHQYSITSKPSPLQHRYGNITITASTLWHHHDGITMTASPLQHHHITTTTTKSPLQHYTVNVTPSATAATRCWSVKRSYIWYRHCTARSCLTQNAHSTVHILL